MKEDTEGRLTPIGTPGHPLIESGYQPAQKALLTYIRSSFALSFSALLFRTEALQEIGGFDLRIRNGGDEYLISQLLARYPAYFLMDSPFCIALMHPNSLSEEIDYALFEKEAKLLQEKLLALPLHDEIREELTLFFCKRRAKILSNAFRDFSTKKEYAKARHFASKALEMDPSWRWRVKRWLMLYPPLFHFNERLKSIEKKLREHF